MFSPSMLQEYSVLLFLAILFFLLQLTAQPVRLVRFYLYSFCFLVRFGLLLCVCVCLMCVCVCVCDVVVSLGGGGGVQSAKTTYTRTVRHTAQTVPV